MKGPEGFEQPIDSILPRQESREGLPPRLFTFYNNGVLVDSFMGDTPENAVKEFELRNQRKFGQDDGDSLNSEGTESLDIVA